MENLPRSPPKREEYLTGRLIIEVKRTCLYASFNTKRVATIFYGDCQTRIKKHMCIEF